MKIGLVGLPLTGKTTFFNLLTGGKANTAVGKREANWGTAQVPDARLDFLSKLYQPRKTVYAQINVLDLVGLVSGEGGTAAGANRFLQEVRGCDALVHVLRAFDHPQLVPLQESINPVRDLETVEMELLFADLELLEKRKARIQASKKLTEEDRLELERLAHCAVFLEEGRFLGEVEFSQLEREALRHYAFLTEKPRLAVVNLDERQFKEKKYPGREALVDLCQAKNIRLLEICAQLEWEISELSETDKNMFMTDLGLKETGIELLARHAYQHLGLLSFFTAGPKEVRAWTIKQGTSAKDAAGKIHSDLARGFIRAEVVSYQDLAQWGTLAKVKEKGLFRLEGKNYLVADGDLLCFRFNV